MKLGRGVRPQAASGRRERDGKGGTIGAGGAQLGAAAVRFGDGPDNGKAEAGASFRVAGGYEALEDAVLDGGVDTGAGVGNDEIDGARAGLGGYRYQGVFGRMVDGVGASRTA